MTGDTPRGTWCIFGVEYPGLRGGGLPHWVETLMTEDGWPQTGLARFVMTFVHRGNPTPYHCSDGTIITDGSMGQETRWEGYLASLPQRRFERKAARLRVVLRGDPALDFSERRVLDQINVADFRIATGMVRQGLAFVQSGLKRSDGVDLSPLILAADRLARREWANDADLHGALAIADRTRRARIDAMDPWLKIDLRGAHPQARAILDMPEDWSAANGFAPHGSDIGADILSDWPSLRAKSVEAVARRFEIDLADPGPEACMDRIQMMLALAFGHVRKSGTCPRDLADRALATLIADRGRAAEHVVPQRLADWDRHCDRYQAILTTLCARQETREG